MTLPAEPQQAADADAEAMGVRLLAALEGIRDVLEGCANESEELGTLPERGWRAIEDAGLFRIKAPASLGGDEAPPTVQLEVFEHAAYIDSSAGWTLFVGAGSAGVIGAWLPEQAMPRFMTDGRLPRVAGSFIPTGTAKEVEGGYRLNGRWPFASGCRHAEWLFTSAVIEGIEPRTIRGFVFPASEATIIDNWQAGGLKGTGSNDFEVSDLFVPAEFMYDSFAPAARGGALFKIGIPGQTANEHAAFALGIARRALDEVAELAKTKARGYVNPKGVASRSTFQYELGRADLRLRAARSFVYEVFERVWRTVLDEDKPAPVDQQVEMRCAAVLATDAALEVCRTAFRYAGAQSLYSGNLIERCLRDIHAAAQHGMVNDAAYELHGRVLLGFPDVVALE
jgi:alkylation response protein AidB-like acyl-CoA dehydrogenase